MKFWDAHGFDLVLCLVSLAVGGAIGWFIQLHAKVPGAALIVREEQSRMLRHSNRNLKLLFWNGNDETDVTDPYLLKVRLTNVGKVDLRGEVFANGKPIKFSVGTAKVLDVTALGKAGEPTSLLVDVFDEATIAVRPALLRVKKDWEFVAVLDGPAQLGWTADHLADVSVVTLETAALGRARKFGWGTIVFGVLFVVTLVVGAYVLAHGASSIGSAFTLISFGSLVTAVQLFFKSVAIKQQLYVETMGLQLSETPADTQSEKAKTPEAQGPLDQP